MPNSLAGVWLVCTSERSDEAVLERQRSRGGASRDSKFGENVLEMTAHRVFAEKEVFRDLAVWLTGRDEPQNLELAFGKPGEVRIVSLCR